MKLGAENGFDADTTENADYFNEDTKKYAAVIFLNTTGNMLDNTRKRILKDIFSQVVALWVFIQQQMANTTGDGMAAWSALILKATRHNRKRS